AARAQRRDPGRPRRLVGALPGCRQRRARTPAAPGGRAAEAAAPARAQAQRGRDRRGGPAVASGALKAGHLAMNSFAYVGLGSNLGHPRRRLARALTELARLPRSALVAASPNYVSAPVGTSEPQPDYVNAVAALRTALAPGAVLHH